jgi:Na+/H+ antiporter NhaD/arsenite permease-like protein
MEVWVAAGLFVGTYVLIASDRIHKTVAALLGGVLMIVLGVVQQAEAFAAIDLNVIFLLLGMMVIANVMQGTGVFQWLAIRAIRLARGDPWRILVVLCLLTAFASAFLANVTVVVLVGPITFFVAAAMGVSPVPYLIAEILASNIGGTATLIGDPPNLLIASAAGIDFTTFLVHLAPASLLILGGFLLLARVMFGGEMHRQRAVLAAFDLDESMVITDRRRLRVSVAVMILTVAGFLGAQVLGYEPATVALLGATVLFIVAREDPEEVFRGVDWSTLLFFVGLFIVVEGIVAVGIVDAFAGWLFTATGGDTTTTAVVLIWASGLASGVIDNIPYTATLIPVVQDLSARGLDADPLWWSLALGADLGGNLTLIGASANIVIASLAVKAGYELRFGTFLRYGIPTVVLSLAIATAYVWVRYLL